MVDTYLERHQREIRRAIPTRAKEFAEFDALVRARLREREFGVYLHRLLPIKFTSFARSRISNAELGRKWCISERRVRLMETKVLRKLEEIRRGNSEYAEIEWGQIHVGPRGISRERVLKRLAKEPDTRVVEMDIAGECRVLKTGNMIFPGKRYFFLPPIPNPTTIEDR